MINVLDLARDPIAERRDGLVWTELFIAASIVILFALSGVHQDWQAEEKYGIGQILWLGIASNGVGVGLAYAFLRLKMRGFL